MGAGRGLLPRWSLCPVGWAGLLWNVADDVPGVVETAGVLLFVGSEERCFPRGMPRNTDSGHSKGAWPLGPDSYAAKDPIFPALFVNERQSLTL